MEINQQTLDFIAKHAGDDVRSLALCAHGEGVDMRFALDQIAGRQTARRKLPSWAATDGLLYPPHLSMEQCSGEVAATYKAGIARRLLPAGESMADLTGGFGVDFSFLARGFREATYVERQEHLCGVARHNFGVLGLAHATVVCGDGVDYLRAMQPVSLVYVDPARRSATGGRTFAIADCEPDVAQLCGMLLAKSDYTMVKLSPMLDWRKAVADMGDKVSEVHIVSEGGECKELLLVLSHAGSGIERLCCANGGSVFSVESDSSCAADGLCAPSHGLGLAMGRLSQMVGGGGVPLHLYEPDASVMKAGCFSALEARFGVEQISANSHLFVACKPVCGFPGRGFVVDCVTTMNKKELRSALAGIAKANITTRNFPSDVATLRRKLRLADGGDTYIFATTLADGTHALIVCRKEV